MPKGPGLKVMIDVFGPIENYLEDESSSSSNPKHFLTVVDVYSHKRCIIPMFNLSTVAVKLAVLTVFQTEGFPTVLVCDGASTFRSLQPWCSSVGIQMVFTQAYASWTHGLVERCHKDICSSLRAAVASRDPNWLESVFRRVLVQNQAPSMLVSKQQLQLPNTQKPWELTDEDFELLSPSRRAYCTTWTEEREKNRNKLLSKKSPAKTQTVDVGQTVLVYKEPKTKLGEAWRIGQVASKDCYGVTLTDKTNHASNHVKPLPQPDDEVVETFVIGDLVLLQATATTASPELCQVHDYDPKTKSYKLKVVSVQDDYSLKAGVDKTSGREMLTKVQGKVEKRVNSSSLFLTRSATAWLRRHCGQLIPH